MPTLEPDDTAIDNLGSHKGKTVRRAVRTADAGLLFLPPYSPISTPPSDVRQAEDALDQGRRTNCHRNMEMECANYLKNTGYASA